VLEREVGFALVYAGGRSAAAAVVFAAEGAMVLLGAHGLEGLNLRVDLGLRKQIENADAEARAHDNLPAGQTGAGSTFATSDDGRHGALD
jgi:hypothetical protein